MDLAHDNPLEDQVADEERRKKIAKIRQALANGTYHVSAEQVADKLIEHMLGPRE
jgi:flagellar biosynthesis anti-sigma factor FlgM